MVPQVLLAALVALIGGAIPAAAADLPAPMTFYVARGAPDSCGKGCDRWIAAEGQIDSTAASRFRRFLHDVRDRSLPIYFSSPGGDLDQALAMGAMLRERAAVARVGRTVAGECGFEAQDGAACIKLKQSGRELEADLWTRGAICTSACPYLILGAPTREIAADAVLGVHSARVIVAFRGVTPTRQMRAEAAERGRERIDRSLASYLKRMGADAGLLELANSVKFEDMHVLTRDEVAHFGFDRREFVETPWTFENSARSVIHKTAVQVNAAGGGYRTAYWRMFCFSPDRFELDYQRQAAVGSTFLTVSIANAAATSLYFRSPPTRRQGFEIWGLNLSKAVFRSLADAPQFEFTETSQSVDGRRLARTTRLSSDGLAGALEKLLATCPVRNPDPLQRMTEKPQRVTENFPVR